MKKSITLVAIFVASIMAFNTSHAAYVPANTKSEDAAKLKTTEGNAATEIEMNQWLSEAATSFKNMNRSEKRMHRQEAKQAIRDWKANRNSGNQDDANINHIALIVLAIFIPPLAVALHEKGINNRFWISLLLTILFFIPGMIYSILVITHSIK